MYDFLPDASGAKGRKTLVGRDEHKLIDRRLRSQKTVEGVAMRRRYQSSRADMRNGYRQHLESGVVHVPLEIEEQVACLGPLAGADLDRDLPRTCYTDEDVVLL